MATIYSHDFGGQERHKQGDAVSPEAPRQRRQHIVLGHREMERITLFASLVLTAYGVGSVKQGWDLPAIVAFAFAAGLLLVAVVMTARRERGRRQKR